VSIGPRVNPSKCCHGPIIEILGIKVNTTRQTASISSTRREDVTRLLGEVLQRRTASALELQRIAGTLVFITRVCPTARAFLGRISDAVSAASASAAAVGSEPVLCRT
jgi:hypothetical protein